MGKDASHSLRISAGQNAPPCHISDRATPWKKDSDEPGVSFLSSEVQSRLLVAVLGECIGTRLEQQSRDTLLTVPCREVKTSLALNVRKIDICPVVEKKSDYLQALLQATPEGARAGGNNMMNR